MKENDKILTRLTKILRKLSQKSMPRIKELAMEFNVTERTIQRDVYQRLLYFPIEKNSEGQLQFIDGFSLDQSILNSDEMMFTYLTLSQIKELNPNFGTTIDTIFSKLLKPDFKAQHSSKDAMQETESRWVQTLEDAILKNHLVTLELHNATIDVKAYKLVNNNDNWSLFAEDFNDGKVKWIPLSTIQNVAVHETRFKLKKPVDEILDNVHESWFKTAHSTEIEVYVHHEIAYFFKRNNILPSQRILKENEDGSLVIQFIANTQDEVNDAVKTWLPYLRVTKPEQYNQQLIAKMQEYIQVCSN
jgi:predicted DNA-binding transcriptional regulator YafY